VKIVGRIKDMVIRGGGNVYPREIEDVMLAHPDVWDAAVIPVPEPDLGEAVVAVVHPRDGVDADESLADALDAWCRARLAAYKVPKRIVFDTDLPRQDNGKLYKRELRDRYAGLFVTPAAREGGPTPSHR